MKLITTLSALLFTACSVPGLQTGSTLSPSSSSPAAPTTTAAQPSSPPAAMPAATPAAASMPELATSDVRQIDVAADFLQRIHTGEAAPGNGPREAELRDRVVHCSQQVEDLIARGYAKSIAMPLTYTHATLGEAEANICQALGTAADGWDARGKQAYAAQNDEELAPYKQAGVAGDKLKLVDDLGHQLIGPGQADPTPAIVAKASVLFSLRHDGFKQWTIVRYAFKGNTQVSVTEKGYADQPGPSAYR